jgi:excinuclease ABC subunit C
VIEGFDMSHTQGMDYVGSKVALEHGRPAKSLYRRYKIRDPTINGSNDIASMREVMTRRYTRALKEQEDLPDLIVVDGGKAQLNMAHTLLIQLGLEEIPHIGISKPPGRSEIYSQPKIILPGDSTPINLSKGDAALKILQLLRDESHRFAINYHRKLRQKRQTKSILDKIPGIGAARKKKLLTQFKSVKRIRAASHEDLIEVLGKKLGEQVFDYLVNHPEQPSRPQPKKKLQLKKKIKKI